MAKPITIVQDEATEITELKKSRKKIYIITAASFAALATVAVAAYVLSKQDIDECLEIPEPDIDINDLVPYLDIPNE